MAADDLAFLDGRVESMPKGKESNGSYVTLY